MAEDRIVEFEKTLSSKFHDALKAHVDDDEICQAMDTVLEYIHWSGREKEFVDAITKLHEQVGRQDDKKQKS